MAETIQAYREGPIDGVIVTELARREDPRGWLVELYREDEAAGPRPVMGYASQTLPGVVRGPHEHRQQTDRFCFIGPGDFRLYLWDARPHSPTAGNRRTIVAGQSRPLHVAIPPGVVHAYKNISPAPALVLNFPDRLYAGPGRVEPVDEIRHEDRTDGVFVIAEE